MSFTGLYNLYTYDTFCPGTFRKNSPQKLYWGNKWKKPFVEQQRRNSLPGWSKAIDVMCNRQTELQHIQCISEKWCTLLVTSNKEKILKVLVSSPAAREPKRVVDVQRDSKHTDENIRSCQKITTNIVLIASTVKLGPMVSHSESQGGVHIPVTKGWFQPKPQSFLKLSRCRILTGFIVENSEGKRCPCAGGVTSHLHQVRLACTVSGRLGPRQRPFITLFRLLGHICEFGI